MYYKNLSFKNKSNLGPINWSRHFNLFKKMEKNWFYAQTSFTQWFNFYKKFQFYRPKITLSEIKMLKSMNFSVWFLI